MRELTVRIRFSCPSLGNVKQMNTGAFLMPRSPANGILFLPAWHRANMLFAAKLCGRHHDAVRGIMWDAVVDGIVSARYYHRHYRTGRKSSYIQHEAFMAGQTVGINCVVPAVITDEDLFQLMTAAGQYKGLSPYKPGEFGLFDVVKIIPRRATPAVDVESDVEVDLLKEENPTAWHQSGSSAAG